MSRSGDTVLLRGVNVVGLDEAADKFVLDDRNLEEIAERWGANVVRLPFEARTAMAKLDELDELVERLAGFGLYSLLALQAAARGADVPLPDSATHAVWAFLAAHYREQPAILFEPYAATAPLPAIWPEAANVLVGTLRAEHPASLLFLPGTGGGTDLVGLPLRFATGDPVHNVVYTLRVAPEARPAFDQNFGVFAHSNPLLVSEWSESGPDLGRSAEATAPLLERYGIGWCACNWNAAPRLVANAQLHRFSETRFGLVVRRALTSPTHPATAARA